MRDGNIRSLRLAAVELARALSERDLSGDVLTEDWLASLRLGGRGDGP